MFFQLRYYAYDRYDMRRKNQSKITRNKNRRDENDFIKTKTHEDKVGRSISLSCIWISEQIHEFANEDD
jgi:hypothetical protein